MTQKVLIADQNLDVIAPVRADLISEGYQVIITHDGQQTLRQAWSQTPDVIVLDMSVPQFDSMTLLHSLKQHHLTAAVPIIMIAASDHYQDMVKAHQLGCDFYWTQPFKPQELTRLVTHIFNCYLPI